MQRLNKGMAMKVVVDHERCQGHAMCFNTAPHLFELDDDGYNRMSPFDVQEGMEEDALTAARMCPERAITLVRD
jgi:ferredoxin